MNSILTKDDLLALAGAHATQALLGEAQRQLAIDYIQQHELPGTKDEAWLRTNLRPLLQHPFALAKPAELSLADIEPLLVEGLDAYRVVFVNGWFQPQLSHLPAPHQGLRVLPMAKAATEHPEHLRHYAVRAEESVFTALNTAFANDGAYVWVPRHHQADKALHVMHIAQNNSPAMVQNRHLVVLEEGAQLQLIETFHSLDQTPLFINQSTQLHLLAGARLHYHVLQTLADTAYLLHHTQAWLQADSELQANTISLQGALVRNNLHVDLLGAQAEARLNGFYYGNQQQHVDNHLYVRHSVPNGRSDQFYRGVLDGEASAVFTGKVYVARDAQQTNANQSNKNILLAETARVSSKPQLEIYADDVACSHGSSTGQIDADALFYLVQRGLAPKQARALLLVAFVADVIDRIGIGPLRAHIETYIEERLKGE